MKRYLWLLLLGAVAGAAGLVALRSRPDAAPAPEPPPIIETSMLTLVLSASGLDPAVVQVPKGHRVLVAIQNARSRPAALALQGYEDLVRTETIAPGKVWQAEFVAERPGEAFAWLADGVPVGHLAVTGSHLVEGHR